MSTAPKRKYTIAEYVALEDGADIKHEFFRGEVFAMSGGTRRHAEIIGNIFFQLRRRLEGTGCRASSSEQRIYVPEVELDTYPDISVVCGEPSFDPTDPEANTNPIAIVEVLSPSTERYDRTIKFGFYRLIPSLKQYVLVTQDEARVETYLRNSSGKWEFADAVGLDAAIQFPSLQCELPLIEIYEGVEFDPQAPRIRPEAND